MSYGVDVLSASIPSSYEEAIAHRNELTGVRDEQAGSGSEPAFEAPSVEMQDLHRRLTARFPCICDDPEGPWADGPLINNFGQHAATLGISFSRAHDVLPFLIATATEMGLWVLDTQDQAVHLPGGTVLRPSAQLHPPTKPWWRSW